MVVVEHALVAPPWSNGWSMVISSLLNEHFYVFVFMSVFSWGAYSTCNKMWVRNGMTWVRSGMALDTKWYGTRAHGYEMT